MLKIVPVHAAQDNAAGVLFGIHHATLVDPGGASAARIARREGSHSVRNILGQTPVPIAHYRPGTLLCGGTPQ